jgi:hypothetical protein
MQPLPPSPALTRIFASSMNICLFYFNESITLLSLIPKD